MLEALVLAGGVGFLLGLRYRVASVVAASALAAIAAPLIALLRGAPLWAVLLTSLGALVAVQVGYLVGALLAYATAAKPERLANAEPRLKEHTPGGLGWPR